MKIKINGEEKKIEFSDGNSSLTNTLASIGYKSNTVVVELNNLIVNSKKWDDVILKEGDSLEIVSIVGGG